MEKESNDDDASCCCLYSSTVVQWPLENEVLTNTLYVYFEEVEVRQQSVLYKRNQEEEDMVRCFVTTTVTVIVTYR